MIESRPSYAIAVGNPIGRDGLRLIGPFHDLDQVDCCALLAQLGDEWRVVELVEPGNRSIPHVAVDDW